MASAHAFTTVLAASGGSSTTTTTSGNPLETLLPLILIFGLAYFFFLRPRSQAARRQRDTLMELSAGDEVLTGAGIFGTVLDVEADRVTLETAPGTRITVLRSTIARRITEEHAGDDTDTWGEQDEDEAHGAYHEYEQGQGHDDEDHEDDVTDEHDDAGHDADADGADEHDVAGHDADADGADEHDADADGADEHGADEHDSDADDPDEHLEARDEGEGDGSGAEDEVTGATAMTAGNGKGVTAEAADDQEATGDQPESQAPPGGAGKRSSR